MTDKTTDKNMKTISLIGKVLARNLRGAAFIACVLMLPATEAVADGFRLPNQDPEAVARGNAFVATADNPSAIFYNPAGITQLQGQNLSVGLYLISTGNSFESTNGPTAESKRKFQGVPQLYYVFSPSNSPVSFGVGVYVPYGLGIDFGTVQAFQNVAQNGSLLYATVNPVIAWKVTPELSLAIGPTINYAKADVNRGFDGPGGTAGQFHLVGDDYAFGFTAGIFWHPCEYVAFGANYHSSTTMTFQGHASTHISAFDFDSSSPATASLNFPQYAVIGMSVRPTDKWNFEFDLDWANWSDVKQISINGTAGGEPIPPLLLNYHDSLMWEFGVTRKLPHGYFVSAGYIYSENSSPNSNYDPLIPDENLHLFSLGVGHKGERFGWTVAYTLALQPKRDVQNDSNEGGPGSSVNGIYRSVNNVINGSVSVKF
jgi:long-chain fatty acid transport protein